MAHQDQNRLTENRSLDDLDRGLDAALMKYNAVEPRAGLEERILANLDAQPFSGERRIWWHWGLATALALALVVGAAWRWGRGSQPISTNHPSTIASPNGSGGNAQIIQPVPAQHVAVRPPVHKKNPGARRVTPATALVARREQFPSPRPLSEQEQLLASYVANNPHHAVLIARAQAELEKRDHEEEMRETNENQDPKQIEQ